MSGAVWGEARVRQWVTCGMPSVSGVCVGEWGEARWEQGPQLCTLTVNFSNALNKQQAN